MFDKVYTNNKGLKIIKDFISKNIDLSLYNDIIDPCAGQGQFSTIIELTKQYDIEPERECVIKKDFFDVKLKYSDDRLIICSPPFMDDYGEKFLDHCSKMSSSVIAIVSKKIDHSNFIKGFKLVNKVVFKDKCFTKNNNDIKLEHFLCLWCKIK